MQRRNFLKSVGVLSLVPVSLKGNNIYREVKIAEINKWLKRDNGKIVTNYQKSILKSFNKTEILKSSEFDGDITVTKLIDSNNNNIGECFNFKTKNNFIVCDVKLDNNKFNNQYPCFWFIASDKDIIEINKYKIIYKSFDRVGVFMSKGKNINHSIKSLKEQRGY